MYVSIPPRFGASAAAGAATVATQKTAPRPAAANPDFLITSSLPLVVGMDRWRHPLPRFPAKHAGIQRRNAAARRKSTHLAAGHPARFNRGKQKLGPISKQGDRYLRRLLVVGAHAVFRRAKQSPQNYPWLAQLLARRPFKVVAIALANKMARVAWALLARRGTYRAPRLAACSMGGKWLELLREIALGVKRIAVLRDPTLASGSGQFGAIQSVAPMFAERQSLPRLSRTDSRADALVRRHRHQGQLANNLAAAARYIRARAAGGSSRRSAGAILPECAARASRRSRPAP